MAARFEKKKQDKQLQLERLEKALALIRKDYDEVFKAATYYVETHHAKYGSAFELSTNSLDLHMAVLISTPNLNAQVTGYIAAKTVITSSMKLHPKSQRTQEKLDDDLAQAAVTLKESHDMIMNGMLSVCHDLLGNRRRFLGIPTR